MKTLIYFNRPDCPENMGISQLTDDLQQFLAERSSIIINPIIDENILTFDKPEVEGELLNRGYAILTETPDDFQN
jgi:hypothetical protein